MKTKKILFLLAFSVMVVGCHQEKFNSFGDDGKLIDSNEPVKKLPWDYPVKPGTDAWAKFQTHDEMVAACQIPEDILSNLSTEDLTDICLQYPLLIDIFAFNIVNDGLDKLFSDFNGIKELYRRKDLSVSLLKRYNEKIQNFSYLNGKVADVDKGSFTMSVSILEALFSRVQEQNNEGTGFKEILKDLVAGYEGKLRYADYFKGTGFQFNFFSRAWVISKMDPEFISQLHGKDKDNVLYSGMLDERSINIINDWSYRLIK